MRSVFVSVPAVVLAAVMSTVGAFAQEDLPPAHPPGLEAPGLDIPGLETPEPGAPGFDAPFAEELAPETTDQGPAKAEMPADPAARLDRLFADLKRERNERAATRIAARIGQEMGRSGSASVDLMMQWAEKAAAERKFDVALDFLDQVTTLRPRFAEGWNRRATVHFLMNNYRMSMADIERALEIEPRHFGALSGLARIMKATDRSQLALDAYERVLSIYPMMRDAQNQVGELADELAGDSI